MKFHHVPIPDPPPSLAAIGPGWRLLRWFAATFALWPLVAYLPGIAASPHDPLDLLAALALTAALVLVPAVSRLPGWFCAGCYIAFDVAATATLFCLGVTGELPTLDAGIAALRTNPGEAWRMMAAAGALTVALLVAAVAWLAGCCSIGRRPLALAQQATWLRLLLLSPLLLAFGADAGATYPLSLARIAQGLRQFDADATNVLSVDRFAVERLVERPEVVVFFVGESSGAAHWQILGYPRPTTPNLARRLAAGEIVHFRAHMSTAALTVLAVPSLLSPFDEVGWGSGRPHRRSAVTVMARAGYRTAWFARNDPQPAATEADLTVFHTDASVADQDTRHDMWLAARLDEWLRRATGSTFVVLHGWGSHLPFDGMYPPEFARWRGDGTDPNRREEYDNSVLYTDAVLERVIASLEREQRPSLLVYTSDHAETMLDGVSRTSAERDARLLHVPLLFWANAAWRQVHAARWRELQSFAASGRVTSHVNIVPTLAALQDIRYEGQPAHRNLLAPEFEPWIAPPALAADERTVVPATPPALARR